MLQRIENIDLIRGFAVLGLPIMNIIVFAMPWAAYLNPTSYGNDQFLSHFLFNFFHLFADQKFMGLFSLLFGASMLMLIEKAEVTGRRPWLVHYSRTFWLLVIGFLHVWFLWEGDVLMIYALIGLALYPMRYLPNGVLIAFGGVALLVASFAMSFEDYSVEAMGPEARDQLESIYSPNQAHIDHYRATYLGSYQELMAETRGENDELRYSKEERSARNNAQTPFIVAGFARAFGMMCLGMVLYRLGVVQGRRSRAFYKRMIVWGFGLGLPIIACGLIWNYANHWALESYFLLGTTFNVIGSVGVIAAYIGLLTLWQRGAEDERAGGERGLADKLRTGLQNVGKMALTNYLMQSLICATIFYGWGLGLYGSVTRLQMLPIIVGIWLFQLWFSSLWLKYFIQGPMEWLWRVLTYFRAGRLRRA